MTTFRLIQNFATFHAAIVCDADVSALIGILNRLGIRSTHIRGEEGSIGGIIPLLRPEQDFLIIDSDTPAASELAASAPPELCAIPVIGLLSGEAPSRLKTIMRIGATSFIRRPVHGATIFPAVYMGINTHRQQRHVEMQLQMLERRRRSRRHVSKAILHRMHVSGLSDDAAYEELRREAMQARLSIEDYCEAHAGEASTYVFNSAVLVA